MTTATAPRKRLIWQTPRPVNGWTLPAHSDAEAQGNHAWMVVMVRQAAREEG